jgi:hypothetical protein
MMGMMTEIENSDRLSLLKLRFITWCAWVLFKPIVRWMTAREYGDFNSVVVIGLLLAGCPGKTSTGYRQARFKYRPYKELFSGFAPMKKLVYILAHQVSDFVTVWQSCKVAGLPKYSAYFSFR